MLNIYDNSSKGRALQKIRSNPVTFTHKVANEMRIAKEADSYIIDCLRDFRRGEYGKMPPEDVEANLRALEAGEGRVIGRYSGGDHLDGDIYIIAYFSLVHDSVEYNYTTVLHCNEY